MLKNIPGNREWGTGNENRRSVGFCLALPVTRLLSSGILVAVCFTGWIDASYAGETIVTRETDRYFFKDGSMMKLSGQYEMTYFLDLDKDTLTRTRIFDYQNNKITPDETIYQMQRQLLSHPVNADRYILKPVIRATGQPSADAVEVLVIEEDEVETVTSSADEIILSRGRRLR